MKTNGSASLLQILILYYLKVLILMYQTLVRDDFSDVGARTSTHNGQYLKTVTPIFTIVDLLIL